MGINWDFISEREGGCVLNGYVPASGISRSGVTIATGVDLGQRSESEIDALDIPPTLRERLKPYVGRIKEAAVDFLKEHPLTITKAEGEALDKAVKGPIVARLKAAYDAAAAAAGSPLSFEELPGGAQTAIASVAFQYGTDLARRAPKFWKSTTRQDWKAVKSELENFGDNYASRRKAEAALLASLVG